MKVYVKVKKDSSSDLLLGECIDYQKALLAFNQSGFEIVPYFSYFDICRELTREDILIDDRKYQIRVLKRFGVANPEMDKHPACLKAFFEDDLESIEWVSKWRCYICYDEIIGISFLKGDWHGIYDSKIVDQILESFKSWNQRPMACAIDFVMTNEGKTILIECKDVFEIESNDLSNFKYARFLSARWSQCLYRQDPLCPEQKFILKSYGYKHFVSNQERIVKGGATDYLEFYPGVQEEDEVSFWNDDSLLINEDIFDEIGLGAFFDQNLKDFDFYGITYVSLKEWESLFSKVENESEKVQEGMKELADWLKGVFKEQPGFTILGL